MSNFWVWMVERYGSDLMAEQFATRGEVSFSLEKIMADFSAKVGQTVIVTFNGFLDDGVTPAPFNPADLPAWTFSGMTSPTDPVSADKLTARLGASAAGLVNISVQTSSVPAVLKVVEFTVAIQQFASKGTLTFAIEGAPSPTPLPIPPAP